jgi:hypothetical protein
LLFLRDAGWRSDRRRRNDSDNNAVSITQSAELPVPAPGAATMHAFTLRGAAGASAPSPFGTVGVKPPGVVPDVGVIDAPGCGAPIGGGGLVVIGLVGATFGVIVG